MCEGAQATLRRSPGDVQRDLRRIFGDRRALAGARRAAAAVFCGAARAWNPGRGRRFWLAPMSGFAESFWVRTHYLFAAAAVFCATLIVHLTRAWFDLADQAMIYLLGVLLVAARLSRGPALFAAFLSVAALDFFFVPPFFTFDVTDKRHYVTFAVLLVVGLIVSTQTVRIREQANARIEAERERTRSNLLAAVSHDLRTPLASIRGSAEVLLDPAAVPSESERRALLSAIRDEADRLAHLVTDLLELTRLDSGVVRVKKDWVPLEEVLSSALHRVEAGLVDRAVEVRLPDVMLFVSADSALLEQALVHLLENAIKYSPPSSPLEISASQQGASVMIAIADRGPGLAPGDEQRVFDKFYRAADQKVPGAGLGLTVCQAIIFSHGGTLRAENRSGGGACFTITLPQEGEPPPFEEEAA